MQHFYPAAKCTTKGHHHYRQPYTDCNYGDLFSSWDRLFGTFRTLPQEELVYGADTYMDEKDRSRFASLVKIPFGKYRSNKNMLTGS